MATRPSSLVRSACLLSVLVVALAVAPAVEALSARASVRASANVDPEADPSSLLPTWPTGTDDPCVHALFFQVDTGTLLNQDCKSYLCVARVYTEGGGGDCTLLRVNPGTSQLYAEILWMPALMPNTNWNMIFRATNDNWLNEYSCPAWTGPGGLVVPPPPPCTLGVTGGCPCETRLGFNNWPGLNPLNPSTWSAGTFGLRVSAPPA